MGPGTAGTTGSAAGTTGSAGSTGGANSTGGEPGEGSGQRGNDGTGWARRDDGHRRTWRDDEHGRHRRRHRRHRWRHAGTGGGTGGMVACAPPTATPPAGNDAVVGSLVQFNDNGGWCWYQDERAVVDTAGNKLVIASTASGGARNGQAEAVVYNLATKSGKRSTLPSSLSTSNVDDHNAPALLVRPDGQVHGDVVGSPQRLLQPRQHLRRHGLGRREED